MQSTGRGHVPGDCLVPSKLSHHSMWEMHLNHIEADERRLHSPEILVTATHNIESMVLLHCRNCVGHMESTQPTHTIYALQNESHVPGELIGYSVLYLSRS